MVAWLSMTAWNKLWFAPSRSPCPRAFAACGGDTPATASSASSERRRPGRLGVYLRRRPRGADPRAAAPHAALGLRAVDLEGTSPAPTTPTRFLGGFQARDIPVGAVVLDSPWETNYNTFTPHPVRYHDFDKLVADLHAKSVHIVLWMTQLVNQSSYDLEQGGEQLPRAPPRTTTRASPAASSSMNGHLYGWWKGLGRRCRFLQSTAVGPGGTASRMCSSRRGHRRLQARFRRQLCGLGSGADCGGSDSPPRPTRRRIIRTSIATGW